MSQTYGLPMAGTATLSASRSTINDAVAAVRSAFSGSSAPSSPVAGQFWLDTDDGTLYVRNNANTDWVAVGNISTSYLGLLRRSGADAMTGPLDMGSQKITNLATATASGDAMSQSASDARFLRSGQNVALGGYKMTTSHTPDDDTEFITKAYADGKLSKAGGGMTGYLDMNNNDLYGIPTGTSGTSGDNAANLAFVRNYFDASTGHDHDGGDSKKVHTNNFDFTGLPDGCVASANGSGAVRQIHPEPAITTATKTSWTGSWTYEDLASLAVTVERVTTKVLARCSFSYSGNFNSYVRFRDGAGTTIKTLTPTAWGVASYRTPILFEWTWTPASTGSLTVVIQLGPQSTSLAVEDAIFTVQVIG